MKKRVIIENQENADIIVSPVKVSKANAYIFCSIHLSDGEENNYFHNNLSCVERRRMNI